MKYSTEWKGHHQVLFGIKMLALHNTLQQKEPSDSSKGFLGCNSTASHPLCGWSSGLGLVNHRTGKHRQCAGQTWPRQLSPIQEQKKLPKRDQWHIQHLLSSYSPWFYLLLQIRTFLERRERFSNMALRPWQRGRAIPSTWMSSQHLLPNQRDVVKRINSFNEDGMKCAFSSPGRRAKQWERRHLPPSSWGRAHSLRVQWMRCCACTAAPLEAARVPGHPSSSGKVAGQLASVQLGADVWAHTHLLHLSQLTWFWWINIGWKSTELLSLSLSLPDTQDSLRYKGKYNKASTYNACRRPWKGQRRH